MARDKRLTKLQRFLQSRDHVIAAHYYYKLDCKGNHLGYGRVGALFGMPKYTIRKIIKRTPKDQLEVKLAAFRFGLLIPDSFLETRE